MTREMWDHDELVGRYLDVGLVPKVGGSDFFRSLCQPSAYGQSFIRSSTLAVVQVTGP